MGKVQIKASVKWRNLQILVLTQVRFELQFPFPRHFCLHSGNKFLSGVSLCVLSHHQPLNNWSKDRFSPGKANTPPALMLSSLADRAPGVTAAWGSPRQSWMFLTATRDHNHHSGMAALTLALTRKSILENYCNYSLVKTIQFVKNYHYDQSAFSRWGKKYVHAYS